MTDEKIFADGFVFKRNEKAPEFVVGRLSIKIEDAVAFMKANQNNGWVNLDIKQARSGNFYVELDTFKPTEKQEAPKQAPAKATPKQLLEEEQEELPF
jgi:hypothetical protein